MEHVRVLYRMANESWRGSPEFAALTAAIVALSTQQPAADGGFTAADMMDARLEGRREACPKCDGTGATLMEQAALADQQGGEE